MVVPGPGTYCFPLEVFETYKVRTYPQRLPLTFAYDDGFDDDDFEPSYAPRAATRSMTPEEELEYEISQIPCLSISPKMIPLDQAVGTRLSIRCNIANATCSYVASLVNGIRLTFLNQTEAEIIDAAAECLVQIELSNAKGSCSNDFCVYRRYFPNPDPDTGGCATNETGSTSTTNTTPTVESTNTTNAVSSIRED